MMGRVGLACSAPPTSTSAPCTSAGAAPRQRRVHAPCPRRSRPGRAWPRRSARSTASWTCGCIDLGRGRVTDGPAGTRAAGAAAEPAPVARPGVATRARSDAGPRAPRPVHLAGRGPLPGPGRPAPVAARPAPGARSPGSAWPTAARAAAAAVPAGDPIAIFHSPLRADARDGRGDRGGDRRRRGRPAPPARSPSPASRDRPGRVGGPAPARGRVTLRRP